MTFPQKLFLRFSVARIQRIEFFFSFSFVYWFSVSDWILCLKMIIVFFYKKGNFIGKLWVELIELCSIM